MARRASVIASTALGLAATATLPAEAKPSIEVRGAVMFWLLDRNNDGEIDKSEVEALRATIFDAVDGNNDGGVTREEIFGAIKTFDTRRDAGDRAERRHRYRDEHGDERSNPINEDFATQSGHGRQGSDGRAERRGGPRQYDDSERRSERMMRRLGITETHALDKTDFVTTTPSLFEHADLDGDGTLSKSEFTPVSRRIGQIIIME